MHIIDLQVCKSTWMPIHVSFYDEPQDILPWCTLELGYSAQVPGKSKVSSTADRFDTVDGSEIRLSPVEAGRLSLYLQGFIHPRWLFGMSSINSRIHAIDILIYLPGNDHISRVKNHGLKNTFGVGHIGKCRSGYLGPDPATGNSHGDVGDPDPYWSDDFGTLKIPLHSTSDLKKVRRNLDVFHRDLDGEIYEYTLVSPL